MQLPLGFYRFTLTTTVVGKPFSTSIVARTPSQAWGKYVAQYFGNSPLKPNKNDYTITKEPE